MEELIKAFKEIRLRDVLDFGAFLFASVVWCALLWLIGG